MSVRDVGELERTHWSSLQVSSALIMTIIGLVHASEGATIRVPDDHPTIQAGIDASASGDTVLVRCGNYFEHNLLILKSLTVLSETGYPDCVTIDAQERGRCTSIGADNVNVEGITLTHGYYSLGGGLACSNASAKLSNCIFADNENFIQGVGGAGVDLFSSTAVFTGCIFLGNLGGAVAASGQCAMSFRHCTFSRNVNNGGIIAVRQKTSAVLENCIVAFNTGVAIGCDANSTTEIRCSDVYGNSLGDWVGCISGQTNVDGNLAVDPLFCDALGGDLRLSEQSPCSADHSPVGCGLIGALPTGCGPQAVESTTWGRVKASYR